MKKVLLLVATVLCAASVSAQTFGLDDKKVSATIGIGGSYGVPISVSYEQGFMDLGSDLVLGLGGYLGYAGTSESFAYGKAKYSNLFIAVMGNVHYTKISSFDLYAGLRFGYNAAGTNVTWDDPALEAVYGDFYDFSNGGLVFAGYVGMNYPLSDSFAINAELGYGLSVLAIGASYKF